VQAIFPIPRRFSVDCLSDCRLSDSCVLLNAFDGFKCHLAGTLVRFNGTLCLMGSLTCRKFGRLAKTLTETLIFDHLTCSMWFAVCSGWAKKLASFLYASTSSNINQFSKFFHCQNRQKICNTSLDPTTPQMCCYTT